MNSDFWEKNGKARKRFTILERLIILTKTDGRCRYCGILLTHRTMTVDHWLPLCHGGTNHLENLFAACKQCNGEKADKHPVTGRPATLRVRPRPQISADELATAFERIVPKDRWSRTKRFSTSALRRFAASGIKL